MKPLNLRPRHRHVSASRSREIALTDERLSECISLVAHKRWTDAISALSRYLAIQPRNHVALYNRAFAYFATEQAVCAHEDVTAALFLRPHYPEALLLRARIYVAGGNVLGALEDATTAVLLNPGDAEAYFFRAQVKALPVLRQYVLASEDIRRVIELKSDNVAAHALDGDLQFAQGNMHPAILAYQRALTALETLPERNAAFATQLHQKILLCKMQQGNLPDTTVSDPHAHPAAPTMSGEQYSIEGTWSGNGQSLVNLRTKYTVEATFTWHSDSGLYFCTLRWKDQHHGSCTENGWGVFDGECVTIQGVSLESVDNRFPDDNIRYATGRYELKFNGEARTLEGKAFLGEEVNCTVSMRKTGS
jgi:tetratricopeptide (TPR) repeat protein